MYQPTSPLTLATARPALQAGLRAIATGQTQFDMAQLGVVDSAAVATMLAWKRAAAEQGAALHFVNLPDDLRSLADLYGVSSLLTD